MLLSKLPPPRTHKHDDALENSLHTSPKVKKSRLLWNINQLRKYLSAARNQQNLQICKEMVICRGVWNLYIEKDSTNSLLGGRQRRNEVRDCGENPFLITLHVVINLCRNVMYLHVQSACFLLNVYFHLGKVDKTTADYLKRVKKQRMGKYFLRFYGSVNL